ncbi:hypothetical protein AGMMS49938_16070 [Fibrobacterales bacterium]|nr:hypothetical protein AGMMS49938_16070 [Fibrobacterales bacterium]
MTNGRPYKPGRANYPPVLLRKRDAAFRHHAYLKISEGCNRACAFCAIPLIRGKQVSSSINDLAEEARQLEKSGVKELTLVAQDLSSYGLDLHNSENLTSLLENLLKKTKIPWIRLMYLYPEHITDDLLNLMATEPRICKYIDMPIQHASDKILKLMRRKGTQKDLRNLIEKIRVKVSGISLRTTLLLGFPGETHEDFEELMRFADDIQFEHLGAFIWSPEEGTSAIKLKRERVPEDVARLRLNALTERSEEISLEKNEQLIGKTVEVILDSVADESEFHFYGRTRGDAFEVDNVVRILEGNGSVGKICKVKIVDAKEHEIDGVIL